MSIQIRESLQKLFVIGISYKKTALDVRGLFSLSLNNQEAILREAKNKGIDSMIVLSTCNRTEIYAYSSNLDFVVELFIKHSKATKEDFYLNGYTFNGDRCVHHLFEVTAGLDSQIIGDFQVVGQVKESYRRSEQADMLNSVMNRLFSFAFQASKKIKTETKISKGAASVSHAAVQYIKDQIPELETCSFLLYGMGNIGKDTCLNLMKHMNNRSVTLINRTEKKAEEIARKYKIRHQNVKELSKEVEKAQVVIVSTAALEPTLCVTEFKNVKSKKLVLDLSVPCNVDSAVRQLQHVNVIGVDELSKHISTAIEQRKNCIPEAKKIIANSIDEFYGWLEVKYLSPVIVALKQNLQKVQQNELNYHKNRLSEDEMQKVEHITTNIVNKIARACINHLKDHHKKQSSPMETLNTIFKDLHS